MAKAKKEAKEQPVEQALWTSADKLRKNMDAAEYKHIVMGLIFLKYISDNFYELYHKLERGEGDYAGANPNDPYEYRAENVFYVPKQARWDYLQGRANLPTKLFLNTQIPACLRFLSRAKESNKKHSRRDKILFVDARNMGTLISRKTRELTAQDVQAIAAIYHNWKLGKDYDDVPGLCKSALVCDVAALDKRIRANLAKVEVQANE